MARHMSALVKQDLAKLCEDGESRRIAMNSLKSFVEQLDPNSMPRFLAQVAEAQDQGMSRCYAISLYEDVARVHGKHIVPHVPRMMSTIIRFLSSSGSSLQLHQPCANVVVAIAYYAIDALTSALQAHAIFTDICDPLLEVIAGTLEPLAAGAAISLQALVESSRWKCASTDLIHETCLRTTVALGDKATRTVGHMQLARALALTNGDVLGAYGLALLRSACQTLRTSTGNGKWHHRVSAARLLQAILSKMDRTTFGAEVAYITQVLESFRHDRIPHVRSAVAETLQTLKSLVSSEDLRRSTKRDESTRGLSFADTDYHKIPILKTKVWSHIPDGAQELKLPGTKSQVSQESQNISFSPSPSSSTPSDSTTMTTPNRATSLPFSKTKKNTRFPPSKLITLETDYFTINGFKALEEKENCTRSMESFKKEGTMKEESLTNKEFITKEIMKGNNNLEVLYPLHDSKYAPSSQNAEDYNEPIAISTYMNTEKAKWEENASTLDKNNSLLGLLDIKIPMYREENNVFPILERREIGNCEGPVEFSLLEDFDGQRSFESMIQKERIGGKKSPKTMILERDEICNVSLLEDDIYFLGDLANDVLATTYDATKSTVIFNDSTYNAQKLKAPEEENSPLPTSENNLSTQEIDSLSHELAKQLELDASTPEENTNMEEVRHDVEEIDLHTSSENGWSVHDNPIASDEGFEHEDHETMDLLCTSTESKVASHSTSNICASPTGAINELEYSSSGSNLHDQQENFTYQESLREKKKLRETAEMKEEIKSPSHSEGLPTSTGRRMCFRSFDEVSGSRKHNSKSTHARPMDSWPSFNRMSLKKRTKAKCKFSYSAFFFLEGKNWTRVWSCVEILLSGSICAVLALPIALVVSTICCPLYLDYNLLVPT